MALLQYFTSRSEVIEQIRLLVETAGCEQRIVDKKQVTRLISEEAILHYYPTVNDAIRAAGYYPRIPSEQDLIRSLQEFYEKTGQVPRWVDANVRALPYSYKRYVDHFGSWNAALIAAGLPVYNR